MGLEIHLKLFSRKHHNPSDYLEVFGKLSKTYFVIKESREMEEFQGPAFTATHGASASPRNQQHMLPLNDRFFSFSSRDAKEGIEMHIQ